LKWLIDFILNGQKIDTFICLEIIAQTNRKRKGNNNNNVCEQI
jgi:hypothetical protein